MSGKIRGQLTLDVRVLPELHKAAEEAGWKTKKIPVSVNDMHDDTIATIYGKGKTVLLTYDKKAYTHNTPVGFVGYIEYDEVEKEEFPDFVLYFKGVISKHKITDIRGQRLQIHKTTNEKIPLQTPNKTRRTVKRMVKKGRKKRQ